MAYSEVTVITENINIKKKIRMKMPKGIVLFVLLISAFFWTGCHRSNNASNSMLMGETVIAADEALKPMINTQLDVFHSIYKSSNIKCNYLSEYDAINLLLKEDIRLAIVGRPLDKKEIEYFKSREIVPESIPLAYDAIALIVPASNTTMALSIDQVKEILTGNINDWSQINHSGKSGSIKLLFDTESSGIIRYLNEKLDLKNKISGNVQFAGSNQLVIESIAGNTDGIGFVGYNWLSETESTKVQETLSRIHFIGISKGNNADTAFLPSVSALYNNTYPLTRKLYAIYTDPSASLARGFLALLTSERGQRIIYRCGLKPENNFQRLIRIIEDF